MVVWRAKTDMSFGDETKNNLGSVHNDMCKLFVLPR